MLAFLRRYLPGCVIKNMQTLNCKPYHARTSVQNLLFMPDGKSVFKIYYVSIIGRDNPEQFEWEYSHYTRADFEQTFLSGAFEGIGFVTAFPHITKVFRFSPYAETILDVSEFHTVNMQPKDCSHEDDSHEFACYAESVISADEYEAWAKAASAAEYLGFRSTKTEFPVVSNKKLSAYWS